MRFHRHTHLGSILMASVSRKPASRKPPRVEEDRSLEPTPGVPWYLRWLDEIYRFLASIKLAVISLLLLSAVLAYGTVFNSLYGLQAAQDYVYGSPLFAAVLAFLGINIFCAASIRFQWNEKQKGWKKTQTGFVVTHTGLLVILAGAFVASRSSYEANLPIAETSQSSELIRMNRSVLRVEKLDSDGQATQRWEYGLLPGPFAWETEKVARDLGNPGYQTAAWVARGLLATSLLCWLGLAVYWVAARPAWMTWWVGALGMGGVTAAAFVSWLSVQNRPLSVREEVVTDRSDPFRIVVRDYLPSSTQKIALREAAAEGPPAVRVALWQQSPTAVRARDALEGEGWLMPSARLARVGRTALDLRMAKIVFQQFNGPNGFELLDDFLHPPENPLETEQARVYYTDASGKRRSYTWVIPQDAQGRSFALPDSNLKVTFVERVSETLGSEGGAGPLGAFTDDQGILHAVKLRLEREGGEARDHLAWSSLPLVPSDIKAAESGVDPSGAQVRVVYYRPPDVSRVALQGRSAVIEIAAGPDEKLYYRVFNREGVKGLAAIEQGKRVPLLGGSAPMKLELEVAEYLPHAMTREVCRKLDLPPNQVDNAIPAARLSFEVGDEKRDVWVRRTFDYTTRWDTLVTNRGTYRISLDFERERLPFELKLVKFEPGKFPGSSSFSSYRSDVLLNDTRRGIQDRPEAIYMNHPMSHDGFTFYQQSFRRVADPETGQEDGVYESTFLVHHNPAREVVYLGCGLTVLGIALQFYMKAGAFSFRGRKTKARGSKPTMAGGKDAAKREPREAMELVPGGDAGIDL
jgi:hypothetical protein